MESIPTPGVYKNRKINANYELKNGKGNLWDASQVSVIIQNEVYIGIFIGRKLSMVRPWERKRNEESEYVKIERHHESIVAEELFREAQKAIKVRKKREMYKKEENPSPLKGKVKCGCCGYGMSLKRTVKRQYYYCRMGSGCGSYLKIGLEPLEKWFGGYCKSWRRHTMKKRKRTRAKDTDIISGFQDERAKADSGNTGGTL